MDANGQEELRKLGLNGTIQEDRKQCGASPVGITNRAVDIGHRFHRDGPNRRVLDAIIGVIFTAQFPNALWCPEAVLLKIQGAILSSTSSSLYAWLKVHTERRIACIAIRSIVVSFPKPGLATTPS